MRIIIKKPDKQRVIETTSLDSRTGVLLTADFVSAVEIEKNGLLLERCAYTSSDEGRMSVKPEPIELLSPDELKQVDAVEIDGQPFLARIDGDLTSVMIDQIYTDEGELDPPVGHGMRIYYKSGSYESIEATTLFYADGYVAHDDVISAANLDIGITWERGAWTSSDAHLMSLKQEACLVVDAEMLGNVEAVCFGSDLIYPAPSSDSDCDAAGEEGV